MQSEEELLESWFYQWGKRILEKRELYIRFLSYNEESNNKRKMRGLPMRRKRH